jgi:hypothetical protein
MSALASPKAVVPTAKPAALVVPSPSHASPSPSPKVGSGRSPAASPKPSPKSDRKDGKRSRAQPSLNKLSCLALWIVEHVLHADPAVVAALKARDRDALITAMRQALRSSHNHSLDLSDSALSGVDVQCLLEVAAGAEPIVAIMELELAGNKVGPGPSGVAALETALCTHAQRIGLVELDLSRNNLSDGADTDVLLRVLGKNRAFRHIELKVQPSLFFCLKPKTDTGCVLYSGQSGSQHQCKKENQWIAGARSGARQELWQSCEQR